MANGGVFGILSLQMPLLEMSGRKKKGRTNHDQALRADTRGFMMGAAVFGDGG